MKWTESAHATRHVTNLKDDAEQFYSVPYSCRLTARQFRPRKLLAKRESNSSEPVIFSWTGSVSVFAKRAASSAFRWAVLRGIKRYWKLSYTSHEELYRLTSTHKMVSTIPVYYDYWKVNPRMFGNAPDLRPMIVTDSGKFWYVRLLFWITDKTVFW